MFYFKFKTACLTLKCNRKKGILSHQKSTFVSETHTKITSHKDMCFAQLMNIQPIKIYEKSLKQRQWKSYAIYTYILFSMSWWPCYSAKNICIICYDGY